MKKSNKKILLHFIPHTRMYIFQEDENNFVSFIQGFECGTGYKSNFTQLLKELLSEKYKIKYRNNGWPGQIRRLAEQLSMNWAVVFKRIAVEVLLNNSNIESHKKILKSSIITLIEKIGSFWFNEKWVEDWSSLCLIDNQLFKQIWRANDLKIIKKIDKEIQSKNIFGKKNNKSVNPKLLKLKEEFQQHRKKLKI